MVVEFMKGTLSPFETLVDAVQSGDKLVAIRLFSALQKQAFEDGRTKGIAETERKVLDAIYGGKLKLTHLTITAEAEGE